MGEQHLTVPGTARDFGDSPIGNRLKRRGLDHPESRTAQMTDWAHAPPASRVSSKVASRTHILNEDRGSYRRLEVIRSCLYCLCFSLNSWAHRPNDAMSHLVVNNLRRAPTYLYLQIGPDSDQIRLSSITAYSTALKSGDMETIRRRTCPIDSPTPGPTGQTARIPSPWRDGPGRAGVTRTERRVRSSDDLCSYALKGR